MRPTSTSSNLNKRKIISSYISIDQTHTLNSIHFNSNILLLYIYQPFKLISTQLNIKTYPYELQIKMVDKTKLTCKVSSSIHDVNQARNNLIINIYHNKFNWAYWFQKN